MPNTRNPTLDLVTDGAKIGVFLSLSYFLYIWLLFLLQAILLPVRPEFATSQTAYSFLVLASFIGLIIAGLIGFIPASLIGGFSGFYLSVIAKKVKIKTIWQAIFLGLAPSFIVSSVLAYLLWYVNYLERDRLYSFFLVWLPLIVFIATSALICIQEFRNENGVSWVARKLYRVEAFFWFILFPLVGVLCTDIVLLLLS